MHGSVDFGGLLGRAPVLARHQPLRGVNERREKQAERVWLPRLHTLAACADFVHLPLTDEARATRVGVHSLPLQKAPHLSPAVRHERQDQNEGEDEDCHALGGLGPNVGGAAHDVAGSADRFHLQRLGVVAVVVLRGSLAAVHARKLGWPLQFACRNGSCDRSTCSLPRAFERITPVCMAGCAAQRRPDLPAGTNGRRHQRQAVKASKAAINAQRLQIAVSHSPWWCDTRLRDEHARPATQRVCAASVHDSPATSARVRHNLRGLLACLHAQNVPRHIGTKVFATDLAARGALDGRAVFGRDAPAFSVEPIPDVLLLDANRSS